MTNTIRGLDAEDRWAINETIALHGHLFDEGELDRLHEIFTADVAYDLTEYGSDVLHGIDAIRDAALAMGPRNPVAHIVTNTVITSTDTDTATARSKALAVMGDRSCASTTYIDTLRRCPEGWRISHRRIVPRRAPLGGLGT